MKQRIRAATALSYTKELSQTDSPALPDDILYDGLNLGFRVHCMNNTIFSALASSHPVIYSRFDDTPFGPSWIGLWANHIVALDFTPLPLDQRPQHQHHRWWTKILDKTTIKDDATQVADVGQLIFNPQFQSSEKPWSLLLIGTLFQHQVWMTLCGLHKGQKISYKECAGLVKKPNAARAVGGAVGCNPISWLVPCHRVVGSNNQFGGFGWGLAMKEKMLSYEVA